MRRQRAQLSHHQTDVENTHSDTGAASLGAFHGGNMPGYINMEMTQSTPLDHFYANPIP